MKVIRFEDTEYATKSQHVAEVQHQGLGTNNTISCFIHIFKFILIIYLLLYVKILHWTNLILFLGIFLSVERKTFIWISYRAREFGGIS